MAVAKRADRVEGNPRIKRPIRRVARKAGEPQLPVPQRPGEPPPERRHGPARSISQVDLKRLFTSVAQDDSPRISGRRWFFMWHVSVPRHDAFKLNPGTQSVGF